jgi:hypothetical protein
MADVEEKPMAERSKRKQTNALKHGAYSTIGLMPGESPALFKKHQKVVVDEFRPNGPVELDIVLTIARLLWRKQNLASCETAKLVNLRFRQILEEEKKAAGIRILECSLKAKTMRRSRRRGVRRKRKRVASLETGTGINFGTMTSARLDA